MKIKFNFERNKLYLKGLRKMTIDNTIENMEKTLAKKKEERKARNVAKIRKLKERIETKMRKISKLSEEVSAMETECADLQSDMNIEGTETKTEPFVPESAGESTDPNKKDPEKRTPAKKK
jgi:predicted RNase H-like nuclease (RuvC/YqgF family)